MDEGSTGALVPAAVKSEGKLSSNLIATEASGAATSSGGKVSEIGGGGAGELDKMPLCPICMQMIKDAFLTACGHSFCYMCIVTHLNNKNDCPCCGNYLSTTQLFPNFLLDKLLKKTSASEVSKPASPVEQFRQALQKY